MIALEARRAVRLAVLRRQVAALVTTYARQGASLARAEEAAARSIGILPRRVEAWRRAEVARCDVAEGEAIEAAFLAHQRRELIRLQHEIEVARIAARSIRESQNGLGETYGVDRRGGGLFLDRGADGCLGRDGEPSRPGQQLSLNLGRG